MGLKKLDDLFKVLRLNNSRILASGDRLKKLVDKNETPIPFVIK
jgi:hypothetical protein